MRVDRDLENAIDLIRGYDVDRREYRSVKIFTDFSLKHFKKYKLEGKDTLLKLRSYDQVADLVSYGANVTCYSTNRFDEYFLNLFLKSLKLSYKEHFIFFMNDYGNKNQTLCFEIYKKIRDNLSDDIRYFFDELYKKFSSRDILNSKLIYLSRYPYEQLERYIRYLLSSKYSKLRDKISNCKIEYLNINDTTASNMFKNESFNFIDLSYDLDKLDEKNFQKTLANVNGFSKILKVNGKIQGFVSRNNDIILPNTKRLETRSLLDPNTVNDKCKKDYAYVYTKN